MKSIQFKRLAGFKHFKRPNQFKQFVFKELKKAEADWCKFLSFIDKKVLLGSGLVLTILIFLILPPPGYYQTLHLFWQPAEVRQTDLDVPLHLYPVNKGEVPLPSLSARSAVVMDLDSAVILYQKNSDLPLLPASTTKIMTALIILENYPLDQVLVVGDLVKNGQVINLVPGEKMTVENLLYGLLVASGNDAALALARNYPGGQAGFVAAMNDKALELNLNQTHFENPTGIDHPNHYSTALDLARLTVYALKNPILAQMVATPKITVWDTDRQIAHPLFNINRLVGKNPYVVGVKTGWTEEAGECLVSYIERDSRRVIIVTLGSQDRFGETEKIIEWVFGNFVWKKITG